MKKAELIFIPLPGTSHLAPNLEFANRLIDHDARISITVLVIKVPFGGGVNTKRLAASYSRFKVIEVPEADPPPVQLLMASPESYFSSFTEKHTPHVRNIIEDIVSSSNSHSDSTSHVTGLVLDIAFFQMIDIATELGLPSYMFYTSNLGILGVHAYLSKLPDDQITAEFQSADSKLLTIPSFVNPVPVSILPPCYFNKDSLSILVKQANGFKELKGIIVNTFAELETYALNSFSGGLNPPIYTVGPLVDLNHQPNKPEWEEIQSQKILRWLDDQPESSVVFLCFGQGGRFGPEQVREIADGLKQSGYRFLWSLRVQDKDGNDEEALPEGFLERVRGRGMTCGWAPQVDVLAHKAIGGFVSHCGWNSIVESLWFGVPIVTWPLYAEQHFNAFRMVKELGLAVDIMLDSKKNGELVMADKLARAVRCVMDGDGEIRKRVKEMSEISRKSVMEGGSSFVNIEKIISLNFLFEYCNFT